MATVETPDVALVTDGQGYSKTWTLGDGLTETREWTGTRAKIDAKFLAMKATAKAGGNIRSLAYKRTNGRVTLTAGYGRDDGNTTTYPTDVTMIEEIYGLDIIRDVRTAPYWTTAEDTKLSNDLIVDVQDAVDNNLKQAEITNFGTWTDSQKQLHYHLTHGETSYYETGMIMRQSLYGVRTSSIKAAFTDSNTVVNAPVFKTSMLDLLEALPSGEWLLKPPQAEYLGHGKWRITIEYHWAEKWSKIYGGTWGL